MSNKFNAYDFAEECYENYKEYQKTIGHEPSTVSFEDFQFEIFPNKQDMKEYLYSTDVDNFNTYLKHFPEIEETFPFYIYKEVTDRLGGNLVYEGNGSVCFSKYSPARQDFSISFDVSPDMTDFIPSLNQRIADYDVSEEAYVWLDESGHGKNGAPYDMKDLYEDIEACKNMTQEYSHDFEVLINKHRTALSFHLTKEQVGDLFISYFPKQLTEKDVKDSMKKARDSFLKFENGNVSFLKEKLEEYYESIGITEEKLVKLEKENKVHAANNEPVIRPIEYIQGRLNQEIYNLEQKEIASHKPIITKFNDRIPSTTEVKICKMFDKLFTESDTYPEKYIKEIVIPARDKNLTKSYPDRWWARAIENAVNSCSGIWQPTFDRMQLFEKFGLIPEGTCKRDSDDPVFERYYEQADKKYGEYMHQYLKLKQLLKPEDREKAIKKDIEWNNRYSQGR